MAQINITRTYPQPDSPSPALGPRERAAACFKYLLNIEPEVAIGVTSRDPARARAPHPLFERVERLFAGHGDEGRSFDAAREVLDLLRPSGFAPAELDLVAHAFDQQARRVRGQALLPSLVPERRSTRTLPGDATPMQGERL